MTGWDAWQSEWAGAAGPLPEVRARTEVEARRHRRARVTVLVLLGVTSLGAVPAFAAPERPVHLIGWGILAFCLALGTGFLLTHRAVGTTGAAAPREALGFLQRRLDSERRAARLTRWVWVLLCVLGIVAMHLLYEEHGSPLPVRLMTLGCYVFGLALCFAASWWFGRIAGRRQAELDAWRSWLDAQGL
jgi:hypothetical protein